MSDPINLNRARKDRARAEARRQADENAARFGRTKAQRVADAARNARADRMLDGHRLEEEEE